MHIFLDLVEVFQILFPVLFFVVAFVFFTYQALLRKEETEKGRQNETSTSSNSATPEVVPKTSTSVFMQPVIIENSVGMKLAVIPAGKFLMGSNRAALDQYEQTQREVAVAEFSIGICEVTQSQFEAVMGFNPSVFKGPENPVEMISWDDAVAFCGKLSGLPAEEASRRVYRLPTEAEWEYACRAGTTSTYYFGEDYRELGLFDWYVKNSNSTTHPVGQKRPNLWGLHDMHGNVAEWCSDFVDSILPGPDFPPEPNGRRAVRGGTWWCDSPACRSATRSPLVATRRYDFLGFRVAMYSTSFGNPALVPSVKVK